jgi:mannosyltransferase OCH1-like enzyme
MEEPGAIPRQVHRIWLAGTPEPDWIRPFADTWRRPGWTLRQWSGPEELAPLVNQDIYDRADELWPGDASRLRADLLRYEILHRLGGVYVDADFECLRPIDVLLEGVSACVAWAAQDSLLANGFMGTVPGHSFFGALVDGIAAKADVASHPGFHPVRFSGPLYLTRMWRECGEDVTVFPARLFYPYPWERATAHVPGEDWPGSYGVHHWARARSAQRARNDRQ